MYNNKTDNQAYLGMNIPIPSANVDGTGWMLNERVKYTVKICAALLSTANTNLDGTGTLVTLITAASNGTMIKRITIKARGTTTQGMIRFYLQQSTTTYLMREVEVPAVVQSSKDETLIAIIDEFFYVEASTVVKGSTENGESFVVYVESVDMDYPA